MSELRRGESGVRGRPAGSWFGRGLVAAGRGVELTGLILAEARLLLAPGGGGALARLGGGLGLVPGIVLAGRGLANRTRRLAGPGSGTPIAVPYQRAAWDEGT